MVRENVTVNVSEDIETRPIAMLVQLASQYKSSVHLESGTKSVNAKSIMGMMTLGLVPGDSVTISADGPDEKDAIEALAHYLARKA